ncbi:MAG: hypothetical protein B6A08_19285 [Sorangiineae bacterium NIC37A_2]|nr:MAG: hypothetical protein B6A08_19285 [Sorangiineae bacterium NIC37A_2]
MVKGAARARSATLIQLDAAPGTLGASRASEARSGALEGNALRAGEGTRGLGGLIELSSALEGSVEPPRV